MRIEKFILSSVTIVKEWAF